MKKSITINEGANSLHLLVKWEFAYRQSRKSDYQKCYLDKLRFKNRIKQCKNILFSILNEKHRNKIYYERFIVSI